MGLTGYALLVTTFMYAGQHKLDLFHALCIFHLVGLVGISVKGSPIRDLIDDYEDYDADDKDPVAQFVYAILYYSGLLGYFAFMIYIFATSPRFGPNPECNLQVQYVFFGINIPATNPVLRGLFLANFCLLIIVIPISLLWNNFKKEIMKGIMKVFKEEKADDGKKGFKMIGEVAGRVYIVIMTELILRRNNTTGDSNDWGFGQILAMLMLIGPTIELIAGSVGEVAGINLPLGSSANFCADSGGISRNDLTRFLLQRRYPPESISTVADTLGAIIRVLVCAVDLAFCAAAGAAAAATGAHANGDTVTAYIVQTGALGGVIASGILGVCIFMFKTASSITKTIFQLAVLPIGTAFAVALAIGNRIFGETPNAILIGAVAAGGPLFYGSTWNPPGGPNRSILIFALKPYLVVIFACTGFGFDALAGYTFAKVAENHGFYICKGHAAAAAGVVYSVLVWILHVPQTFLWMHMSGSLQTIKAARWGRAVKDTGKSLLTIPYARGSHIDLYQVGWGGGLEREKAVNTASHKQLG
ncbi:hypothetical protein K432DRAFT_392041 [Lepidopterella palustris CBS 459.81]|uniref:Uncharacterized protein n=1 Tax=Lepidopterella palustris CBS 459.81 TaxID=1314670 RepID=A0A8E2EDG6_9PEZI|nr:hypothetical protein K432DRAFT_392041 [Lepidopterella palustris CBS 459.81]